MNASPTALAAAVKREGDSPRLRSLVQPRLRLGLPDPCALDRGVRVSKIRGMTKLLLALLVGALLGGCTSGQVTHVVQRGETAWGIAMRYGVSLDSLKTRNANADLRQLQLGQTLIIKSVPSNAPANPAVSD